MDVQQSHPMGHHFSLLLTSEYFVAILGGAPEGPHRGSSSGFDAFSWCDSDGFATAFDKIRTRETNQMDIFLSN